MEHDNCIKCISCPNTCSPESLDKLPEVSNHYGWNMERYDSLLIESIRTSIRKKNNGVSCVWRPLIGDGRLRSQRTKQPAGSDGVCGPIGIVGIRSSASSSPSAQSRSPAGPNRSRYAPHRDPHPSRAVWSDRVRLSIYFRRSASVIREPPLPRHVHFLRLRHFCRLFTLVWFGYSRMRMRSLWVSLSWVPRLVDSVLLTTHLIPFLFLIFTLSLAGYSTLDWFDQFLFSVTGFCCFFGWLLLVRSIFFASHYYNLAKFHWF